MAKMIAAAGVFAFALATSSADAANLVINGNFATGAPASGCTPGITSLPGWTISNNVDLDSAVQPFPACSGISPPVGTYFLDLTGSYAPAEDDRGTVSQTIVTHAGATYDLSFYFGGNPQWQSYVGVYPNDGAIKSMDVLLNGDVIGSYSVNTAGVPITDGQFKLENIDFIATSSSTMLSFESLDGYGITAPSDFGPLLADVSLVGVPEPGTLALIGVGLAGLGFVRRWKVLVNA
jgi:Protein of unknown function (DUF642)/PEP-CTERM motif